MADKESGPKLVWTFPLLTRIQNGSGLVDFSQGTSTVGQKVQDVRDNNPVRNKLSGTISDSDDSDSDEVGELEDEVEQVKEDSEVIFGDEEEYSQDGLFEDDEHVVEMSDDVFIPPRIEIDEGDTVVWKNIDDSPHRVVSTEGDQISTNQIEAGKEFEHTFNSEGVTKYIDSIVGGNTMCGAVIVGDASLDEQLRCEEEVERELFDEVGDDTGDDALRTMSAAAEEKQEMDVGF